jgi:TIR domain
MSRIFINYRREDGAPYAGRLYDRLAAHFGEDQVFMDIDNIALGEDFAEVVARKVGACDVLIAVIGKSWVSASDTQGRRRLDLEDDWVRMEITHALKRGIKVIPILVGGAVMPEKRELPPALAAMTTRNALTLSDMRFRQDVGALIRAIEKIPATRNPQTNEPNLPDTPRGRPDDAAPPPRPPADETPISHAQERSYRKTFGPSPQVAHASAVSAKQTPRSRSVEQPVHGLSQAAGALRSLIRRWRERRKGTQGYLLPVVVGMLVGTVLPQHMPELFDYHRVRSALAKSLLFGMLPVVGIPWIVLRRQPALARAWIIFVPLAWIIGAATGFRYGNYFAGYAGGALTGGFAAMLVLRRFLSNKRP